MNSLVCAASLEASIRQELENMGGHLPPTLQPFIEAIHKFQAGFELLLDRAQGVDVNKGKFPPVSARELLGEDDAWQHLTKSFSSAQDKSLTNLTALWMIYTLIEKSTQFYQQASKNSAHPAERLFFGSLAEIKGMLRRRIDSLTRIMYNELWGEVGFAPFILGKD